MNEEIKNYTDSEIEKNRKFEVVNKDTKFFNLLQVELANITYENEIKDGKITDEQLMSWIRNYSLDFRAAFKEVFFFEDDFMGEIETNREAVLEELLAKTYELHDLRNPPGIERAA